MRALSFILALAAAVALTGCAPAPAAAGAGGESPPAGGANAPQPAPRPITSIAFVGDSLTARCELSAYYPAREAYNFGVDGDTVQNVRDRMGEVYAANPSAVVLLAGINDLAGLFASPGAVAGELAALLAEIREKLPDAYIFVQSLYPVNNDIEIPLYSALNDRVRETNGILKELCADEGYIYIDVYSALAADGGVLAAEYTADGVHLSARGYEAVSQAVGAALDEEGLTDLIK